MYTSNSPLPPGLQTCIQSTYQPQSRPVTPDLPSSASQLLVPETSESPWVPHLLPPVLRNIRSLFLGRELILRIRPLSLLPLPPQSGYLLPRLLRQPLPWSLSCCCHATCYGECALPTATRERFQKK